MVDHKGELLDGDELLYIIARSRQLSGELSGPVVGTLMSNLGLEHALKGLDIAFLRARVGDRFVMELLKQHGGTIGGESSGHIICLDRTSTGDGVIAALQVLVAMVKQQASLHELKQGMRKYPQHMINVALPQRLDVAESNQLQEAVRRAEKVLDGKGRVLLRPSGTEPLIRIMVEGEDQRLVVEQAEKLAAIVEQVVNPKADIA
jgi:phosphoglucosamine mutase